jgi:hypothetical protein
LKVEIQVVITKSMNGTTKAIVDPTTHLIEESFVVEGDMQWQVRYAILETNKKIVGASSSQLFCFSFL